MQLSLFLEVRKLLKLKGVAYLEGRFKSGLTVGSTLYQLFAQASMR